MGPFSAEPHLFLGLTCYNQGEEGYMRSVKSILWIAVIAFAIQAGGSAYCDDNAISQDMRRMEGTITAVDTFNSSLTVQWQGMDLIHYSVTTFIIPEGMTFSKGTDTVDIMDVNIGDPVTIEYYVDGTGTPKIVRMDVSQ